MSSPARDQSGVGKFHGEVKDLLGSRAGRGADFCAPVCAVGAGVIANAARGGAGRGTLPRPNSSDFPRAVALFSRFVPNRGRTAAN